MKKILVFQHVPFEPLGNLDPLLKAKGFRIKYVNFGRDPDLKPSVEKYDGLIVLGGSMSANDIAHYPNLETELAVLKQAIVKKIPILGICLGAQLLSKALGGTVSVNAEKEIGWYQVTLTPEGQADPVLSHFQTAAKVFQWHGDTFSIPDGAKKLATSEKCQNQAFRWGDRIYGFQFHLEVDQPLIERWLTVSAHQAELAALAGKIDPETIRTQTDQHIASSTTLSQKVFSAFIALLGVPDKQTKFISR